MSWFDGLQQDPAYAWGTTRRTPGSDRRRKPLSYPTYEAIAAVTGGRDDGALCD